ncbi:Hypothetical Protein SLY_0721 [Strawberry lethal yellows phytoplasma (CPA) str. NZSb11]|uniref:Uncharacterized protein n=1 Tax=Strawberry lethal yellows phytoplasma (CPA) str. NZSb11 TaxID=980422 RepID=R4RMS4_PHYAS|nr:Hypothetical Protein SLY_0721 [Strawberry lethal yellows phytoplasma (CPA) str. NZSb11]
MVFFHDYLPPKVDLMIAIKLFIPVVNQGIWFW